MLAFPGPLSTTRAGRFPRTYSGVLRTPSLASKLKAVFEKTMNVRASSPWFWAVKNILSNCWLPLIAASSSLPAAPDHGVIHFYEPKETHRAQSDAHDFVVAGAEGIFWWGDLEREEGVYDWSRVDEEIAAWQRGGKRLDIRLGTAHNSPFIAPQWLFDRYHVRRIGRGHWTDCEANLGDYVLGADGQRTDKLPFVVGGNFSIASVKTDAGKKSLCALNPQIHLDADGFYAVEFDCRTSQPVTGWVEISSALGHSTNRLTYTATANNPASQSFTLQMPPFADGQVRFGYDGPGTLSLDHLNIIRLVGEPPTHTNDFEKSNRDWELRAGAQITHNKKQVITGLASLLITGGETNLPNGLRNHAPDFALQRGEGYLFELNYHALSDATLRYRIINHDAPYDVLDKQTLNIPAGKSGRQTFYYPAFLWRDHCDVEISVVGSGEVVIDDLKWVRWSDRVTCFPDYFNPVFQEKWTAFIAKFAERYGENPAIGTISVGGFGRWEETILDDDAYGGLDEQWLARGFTPEKYLARITDCLDLYRRLLPHKSLRICLAYGLYQKNHRDWLYRRVAQAAVARGVGLKQNGLSEKWDMWDDNTSASYLWNRYRFTPGVTLTLETGGQIARAGPGGGHPISFLNRGMIDGADLLFLYGSDIVAQPVHQYLRWLTEQMGRPLISRFYCRLGDTSLKYDHSPVPLEYRNLWLGLRQFQDANAQVIYTNRLGEKCAATSPGNPQIIFDVDDRQQYHGMNGVVLSVQYLDEGTDKFEVKVFNQSSRAWQNLGVVQKTGSGQWRTAAFAQPDWCRSSRNSGEDDHSDVVINDLGDGAEFIANLEMNFVPAREWQRTLLAASEPAAAHEVLTNILSREIEIPAGQPLNFVAVPLWTGSLEANGLRGHVFALTEGGEKLVSDKEYALPADKDWFELPIVPEPNCSRYRIELSQPKGSVGWYRAADGSLPFRAWRYAESETKAAKIISLGEKIALNKSFNFAADEPFFGLHLNLAGTNHAVITARLRRELPSAGWSPIITEQVVTLNRDQPTSLWFEPQTAGNYQIELTTTNRDSTAATLVRGRVVEPIFLTRRESPQRPLPFAPRGGIALFQPTANGEPAWQNFRGLKILNREMNTFYAQVIASDAAFEFTLAKPATTATNQLLALQLRNGTSAGLARIFWAGAGEPFDPVRSAWIPLVANDSELREYHCELGLEANWRGDITRLRIEPATGLTERGTLSLGPIRLLKSTGFQAL